MIVKPGAPAPGQDHDEPSRLPRSHPAPTSAAGRGWGGEGVGRIVASRAPGLAPRALRSRPFGALGTDSEDLGAENEATIDGERLQEFNRPVVLPRLVEVVGMDDDIGIHEGAPASPNVARVF